MDKYQMTNSRRWSVNSIIKERRKQLKISQTELAKSIGMSLRQYQYIESGNGRLYLDNMKGICTKLDLAIFLVPNEGIL